jgi:hypothetical protein
MGDTHLARRLTVLRGTPASLEIPAQLDYRNRDLVEYVGGNGGLTINQRARHCRGEPTLTATAESAVNQVLNQRMCKRKKCAGCRSVAICWHRSCAVVDGDIVGRLARYEAPREPSSREAVDLLQQFMPGSEVQAQVFKAPYSTDLKQYRHARHIYIGGATPSFSTTTNCAP